MSTIAPDPTKNNNKPLTQSGITGTPHMEVQDPQGERIAQIEAGHLALQKDVGILTRDVGSLTTAVSSMADNVNRLASTQALQQRTNWGNLAAWASVILLVLGLVVYEPMRQLQNKYGEHVVDGHPHTVVDRVRLIGQEIFDDIAEIQGEIDELNDEVDTVSISNGRHDERILDIERRISDGTTYRAGRPQ